jgi:hypothetical protein
MKKLITTLLLTSVLSSGHVSAHGWGHGVYRGGGWITPTIIGGVVAGAVLSQYYYNPMVVYTQPPVQVPPPGFHWQYMIDPATNQQRMVLVPN